MSRERIVQKRPMVRFGGQAIFSLILNSNNWVAKAGGTTFGFKNLAGLLSALEPPDSFPNSAVKRGSGDDSWSARTRENSSRPAFYQLNFLAKSYKIYKNFERIRGET